MKTTKEIVDIISTKKYILEMGANKVANWLQTSPDIVREAKKIVRANIVPSTKPKVLVLDIETAPIQAYVWSLWKQNVYMDQIEADWFCLTWAAKWLFEDKVMSDKLTSKEAKNEDDGRLMKGIWKLLEEADVVIAHNGGNFDLPKLNTRFLLNGMTPPLPYQLIDTLKVAKREFSFSSNKLDYINTRLGIGVKTRHSGMEMWKRCVEGDKSALKEMEKYNKNDVVILEETYVKLRPWIKGHPNMGHFVDTNEPVCPTCGHSDLKWGGYYSTAVSKFQSFRCTCGAIGRCRVSSIPKDKRGQLTVSVVR